MCGSDKKRKGSFRKFNFYRSRLSTNQEDVNGNAARKRIMKKYIFGHSTPHPIVCR
jgi:hypothetical protein